MKQIYEEDRMKKRAIPVLIALFLIVVVAAVAFGNAFLERYTYSKERMDLDAYYGISGEQLALILQDEMLEQKALLREGRCYLDIDTVHQYFNEIFYADMESLRLLYTTATDTYEAAFGQTSVLSSAGEEDAGYTICFVQGDVLYIALDYVKKFTNFSYEKFDRVIQIYTQWGVAEIATVKKDTAVRERGGIKSPILRDISQGETVEILEEMETWTKVKTEDAVIGYVENKRLSDKSTRIEEPVTTYEAPEYTSLPLEGKVSLGWHAIGGVGGNDTLDSMAAGTKGMNVIAPTWFSLNNDEGGFRSFASADYVSKAHAKGLKVWGVWDDFNYGNEVGQAVDIYRVLSTTDYRRKLVADICDTAEALALDGVNIDFEKVGSDSGIHFVQFLRELSVACREKGLTLSVDNYVPFQFNNYYRLDIQGQVCDYVIIMGYDEHWHGSQEPGSVASISYVSNGLDKTLEAVPAQKVVNALPFYTILWKTQGTEVSDEYLTIRNTQDYLSRVDAEVTWDEETCQNYVEWTSGDTLYQIWLEDAESISVKLNVMRTKGIGGVAVWRLGYGTDAIWELLNAYVQQ